MEADEELALVDAFVAEVMAQIKVVDPRDEIAVRAGTRGLYYEGFNTREAVKFSRCLEEVNPELDEALALCRMADIRREVNHRLDEQAKKDQQELADHYRSSKYRWRNGKA